MSIKYLHGNCLDVLKTLEDKSVYTCVTSPPYWGLRDYGTEPIVWDANAGCVHKWEENSCCLCGAWRGQLGFEPVPEMYVSHLLQIFREIRRVLKDEGTLWLNIGDSYVGGKGQSGTGGAENQEERYSESESLNRGYQTLGGKKKTRPTDDRKMMKTCNLKSKDLVGIPWMVAFALRNDGWYLRSDIIWHKESCMPESVKDRPTRSHEYIFLLSKNDKYYYDIDATREPSTTMESPPVKSDDSNNLIAVESKSSNEAETDDRVRGFKTKDGNKPVGTEQHHGQSINYHPLGRNPRTVWVVNPKPFPEAHFAVYPPELITPCIKAGCPEGEWVLDPFGGSGTTAVVCQKLNRNCILIDVNGEYIEMQKRRTEQQYLWED